MTTFLLLWWSWTEYSHDFENAILRACCKSFGERRRRTSRLAQWGAHFKTKVYQKFGCQEKFCYRVGKFSEDSGLFSEWPGENSAKVLCWLLFLGPFCFSETGLCKWLYLFVANRRWGYSKEVISPVRVFNWLKLNILDHSWNKMTEALFYTFCIPKRTLSRPYRRYGIHFLYSYSENYPRCENYFRNYLWVALREKW